MPTSKCFMVVLKMGIFLRTHFVCKKICSLLQAEKTCMQVPETPGVREPKVVNGGKASIVFSLQYWACACALP